MLTGASLYGRSSSTLPTISIEDFSVIGSAGYQPAACIAQTTSRDVADQPDIHGIAGNILPGARHHRHVGQPALVLVMRPEAGQHQVSDQAIADEDESVSVNARRSRPRFFGGCDR